MTPTTIDRPSSPNRLTAAVGCFLLGTALTAMGLQSVFNDRAIAENAISRPLWAGIVAKAGATPRQIQQGEVDLPFWQILQPVGIVAFLGLAAGVIRQRLHAGGDVSAVAATLALRGWAWWLLPGLWELLRVAVSAVDWPAGYALLLATLPVGFAVAAAGWLATLFAVPSTTAAEPEPRRARFAWPVLGLLCLAYVGTFTWMNWQLYWSLEIPHGDSAMYEEHLWNLTHGKGFRSYLDNGRLFLGEHVQVIHLALLPLHAVWPSQLMLELCESLALASGAIPVFWMTRRHTGSATAGVCLAAVYLLAFPVHFLDISIDTKTFRPISFGVPLLLFALDQMERERFRTMLILLFFAIAAKEDFAVIVSMIGLWLAATSWRKREPAASISHRRWLGIGMALFGAVYVFAVIKLVIPAFRDGDPHYFRYFGELGSSPGDVLEKLRTEPGIVFGKLFSRRSLLYLLLLLAPIGFLPLCSPGRAATALPLFGVLCLLELTADPAQQGTELLVPVHHFHAPILPVLFWAAAAGLGNLRRDPDGFPRISQNWGTAFALASALTTGLFFSYSPLSILFWDSGSDKYWKTRFIPDERARKFAIVEELIPEDARVFSTDFVHTRLTHRRRSYDYSAFARKSDEELTNPVPGETYYIVIDLQSRYSTMRSPADVPEYRDHPEAWELVRHDAEEYFVVLRRRS